MSYKNDLCNLFINEKIDVFIGIDSPDFNMQIQKQLKKISKIKTVQLVTPIWAWRKGRLKNIKKYTDSVHHYLNLNMIFIKPCIK